MAKGFQDIVKQAQQMQAGVARLQQELADRRVEASVGGGAVTVVADGAQTIVAVRISPAAAQSGDAEMLSELVLTGVNQALQQSRDLAAREMSKLTGGMGLPGLF